MEDVICDAGGGTNFEAIITFPNTETQIPSSYKYTYTIIRNEVVDIFDIVNLDEVKVSLGLTGSEPTDSSNSSTDSASARSTTEHTNNDISSVHASSNGQITNKEAKAAGFSMPIMSAHWLYVYMQNNNDSMVRE